MLCDSRRREMVKNLAEHGWDWIVLLWYQGIDMIVRISLPQRLTSFCFFLWYKFTYCVIAKMSVGSQKCVCSGTAFLVVRHQWCCRIVKRHQWLLDRGWRKSCSDSNELNPAVDSHYWSNHSSPIEHRCLCVNVSKQQCSLFIFYEVERKICLWNCLLH